MKGHPVDVFCTPEHLARKMVAAVGKLAPKRIADFAAGDGMLLRVAQVRWARSQFIAVDIRRSAVTHLQREHTRWVVAKCDFLSDRSRRSSQVLVGVTAGADVILLNPPFSLRGNGYHMVSVGTRSIRCSRAMAFLLTSFNYLASAGVVVAVLPAGCLTSERDTAAWEWILARYKRSIVAMNGNSTFDACRASTAVVRLKRRRRINQRRGRTLAQQRVRANIVIRRGRIQMHTLNGTSRNGVPLIHTTDLRHLGNGYVPRMLPAASQACRGPCVLIPRVGLPDKGKVRVIEEKRQFILSDCVFGLLCSSANEARHLHDTILSRWTRLRARFGGTGAPFITMANLAAFLRQSGYAVQCEPPSQVTIAKRGYRPSEARLSDR